MHQRSTWRQCRFWRGYHGQRLVLDDDALAGILGSIATLGGYRDHALADQAHLPICQRILMDRDGWIRYLSQRKDWPGTRRSLLARQNRNHAGHLPGAADICRNDTRMSIGATHQRNVEHARKLQ